MNGNLQDEHTDEHTPPKSDERPSRPVSKSAAIIASRRRQRLQQLHNKQQEEDQKQRDSSVGRSSRGRSSSAGRKRSQPERTDDDVIISKDDNYRTKSLTGIFQSIRQKKDRQHSFNKELNEKDCEKESPNKMELSTEVATPGVLKVFGDTIVPGATYKSVLAAGGSNAAELVKEALERYGISRSKAPKYVLCDVIGKYQPVVKVKHKKKKNNKKTDINENVLDGEGLNDSEGKWKEECVRVIGDQERPLELQVYWKPPQGLQRRFELRLKADVQRTLTTDTATSGINANARRMLRGKAAANFKYPLYPSDDRASVKGSSDSETDACSVNGSITTYTTLDVSSEQSSIASESLDVSRKNNSGDVHQSESNVKDCKQSTKDAINNEFNNKNSSTNNNDTLCVIESKGTSRQTSKSSANGQPYLLCLSAFDDSADYAVVYLLLTEVTVIGSDAKQLDEGRGDICLDAPDVLPRHCCIHRKCTRDSSDPELLLEDIIVEVEPLHKGVVCINNSRVLCRTPINPGQILSVGEHYVFLYKLPRPAGGSTTSAASRSTGLVETIANVIDSAAKDNTTSKSNAGSDTVADSLSELSSSELPLSIENSELREWRLNRKQEYEQDHTRLKLSFVRGREDELIMRILDQSCMTLGSSGTDPDTDYALSPAYLITMLLEYSAAQYDQIFMRSLMLTVGNHAQNYISKKTKCLADQHKDIPVDQCIQIDSLLADLTPIVQWMANALELVNLFRHRMTDFMSPSCNDITKSTDHVTHTSSQSSGIEDEVVQMFEEIVMYTFQQSVYYITKTLYSRISAILDNNPFQDDDDNHMNGDPGSQIPRVSDVLHMYTQILECLHRSQLHQHVRSQLFSYIFYFTSTSLFNAILSKGNFYFRWSRGVQMRGNLDMLEAWAVEHNLQNESSLYMEKINCLVDLLAIQKAHLIQSNWKTLHHDHPSLTREQLYHVLMEYQLGASVAKPDKWDPPSDEIFIPKQLGDLLESFKAHPPLVLPDDGFSLNLKQDITNDFFKHLHNQLLGEYGVADDDVDSGLSVGATSPVQTCNSMPPQVVLAPPELSYIPQDTMYTKENDPVLTPRYYAEKNIANESTTEPTRTGNCDAHGMNSENSVTTYAKQPVHTMQHVATTEHVELKHLSNQKPSTHMSSKREHSRKVSKLHEGDLNADILVANLSASLSSTETVGESLANKTVKEPVTAKQTTVSDDYETRNNASCTSLTVKESVERVELQSDAQKSSDEREIFVDFSPTVNHTLNNNMQSLHISHSSQYVPNNASSPTQWDRNGDTPQIILPQLIESSIDVVKSEKYSDINDVDFQLSSDNLLHTFLPKGTIYSLEPAGGLSTIAEEMSDSEQVDKYDYLKDKFGEELIGGRFKKNKNKTSLGKAKQRVTRLSKAHADDDKVANCSEGEPDVFDTPENSSTGSTPLREPTYVNFPFNFDKCPDWNEEDYRRPSSTSSTTSSADGELDPTQSAVIKYKSVLKKRLSASQHARKTREERQRKKSVTIHDEVEVCDQNGKRNKITSPPLSPVNGLTGDDAKLSPLASPLISSLQLATTKNDVNNKIRETMLNHLSQQNRRSIPPLSLPSQCEGYNIDSDDSFTSETMNMVTNNIHIDIPMENSFVHDEHALAPIHEDESLGVGGSGQSSNSGQQSGQKLRSELYLNIADDRIVSPSSRSVAQSASLSPNHAHTQSHFTPIHISNTQDDTPREQPEVGTPPREGSPSDMVPCINVIEDQESAARSKYATTDDFNALQQLTTRDQLNSIEDSPLRSPLPGDDIHTPLELLPVNDDAIVSADEQECYDYVQEYDDDVFAVELEKDEQGLGLGLIDGLYTSLHQPGIYIRTLVAGQPASKNPRMRLGDRILAVNGASVVGADYQRAMNLIRTGGERLRFLIARSPIGVAMHITATTC